MTDTAHAQSQQDYEKKQAEDKHAQDKKNQEEKSFLDQERERAERRAREDAEQSARVREQWRSKFATEDVKKGVDANVWDAASQLWRGAPVGSLEFAAGISNIKSIMDAKKAPGVQIITSKFGNDFAYINTGDGEFIGLTKGQAQAKPLTMETAEDIALTAFARGWTSVTVQGSREEKDLLWMAAKKYGLAVGNYEPHPDVMRAYEKTKAAAAPIAGLLSAEPKATAAPGTPGGPAGAPATGTRVSRFSKDSDIIDAEFTVVEKNAKALSGSKIAGLLPPPADQGRPSLPPPAGPKAP